jgi:hypothetical protein
VNGLPPKNWGQWRQQLNPNDYDERWRRIEATGANPHGEADFVFSYRSHLVLDGGCGTGRVATSWPAEDWTSSAPTSTKT